MSVIVDIDKALGEFHLNVSFEAEDVVHGLLGASGSGKTMTLRCIAGIVTPDRGHIEINGRVLFDSERGINLAPQKRDVGLLFQNYALFPNMTVDQNLKSPLRRQDKRTAYAEVQQMIRRFRLEGLENHLPAQLSGGQQQRVALARILLTKPGILMLDEPLTALDNYLRWQTEMELAEILEQYEGTTLLVTHRREEVYHLCKTVTVVDHGLGQGEVPVKELFDTPRTLAECLLIGCKNYSRMKVVDDKTVRAIDWNVDLTVNSVHNDANYVAIRAHTITFSDKQGENTVPCRILRIIEDIRNVIIMFSTPGGDSENHRIRVECSRDEWQQWKDKETFYLKLEPEQLMILD